MSFVRVGRSHQQSKGKRPARPKKAAPKKEWVSTVSDLSVHKLTPAELSHRHEMHKSHNMSAAQWELKEKALRRRLRHPDSPAGLNHANLSIIREVFSEQLLLQDVLDRSDRALAVVKDLFGDAPRRQAGHPTVTVAPHCNSDAVLPVLQRADPPTQLLLLSQSMMDQQALNEVKASEGVYSDEDMSPAASSDCRVIRRTNVQKMKAGGTARNQQKVYQPRSEQADRENVPVTPCTSGRPPDERALNATVAIQRVQSRQSQSEKDQGEPSVLVSQILNPEQPLNLSGVNRSHNSRTRKGVSSSFELDGTSVSSLSGNQSSLGLLQAMLGQVEEDLNALSPDLEPASAQSQKQSKTNSLTGFSVALVSTLGRLVNLFRQREEEAQKEAQERRKLEEQLIEQCRLIDALTAETMTLREESAAMQQWRADMEQKLDSVVLVMGEFGLLEAHIDPPNKVQAAEMLRNWGTVSEQHSQDIQPSASPTVLHWQQTPVTHPLRLHQASPPVLLQRSCKEGQAKSSASSTSSLRSTSPLLLPSGAPISRLLPEAMLADIALLSKETDQIKAQLKSLGSVEVSGSPDSSTTWKCSSSGSTGKVTPTDDEERRTSVPSNTGRRSHHVQSEGEQLNSQDTTPNSVCVKNVEQHLRELNRQSTAARVRLLELIDQQRQTVSTCGSPIPTSAISPHSTGGSPEVSMLLPTQELLSMASTDSRRYTGSEVSSQSLGREAGDFKAHMQKRREPEGWFALSTHVKS